MSIKLFARKPTILPGFAFALGFTLLYLLLVVLVPLAGLFTTAATLSWHEFLGAVMAPRVLSAYRVSFGMAFLAAIVNTVFGFVVAWVLVRYRLPLKRVFAALVDLPLALPTAIAGIALATLYAPSGWLGRLLAPLGLAPAFHPAGIAIALVFVGLPFVVRTVEPVLRDVESEVEDAAFCLGANRWQIFTRVLLPYLTPALLTGFTLAFARGLGEYGSVIFIAGNLPMISEIVPLVIVTKLEQYDYAGAAAVAVTMLLASLLLFSTLAFFQRRGSPA